MARKKEKQKESSQAAKERVREQMHQRPVTPERLRLSDKDREALAAIWIINPRLPNDGKRFLWNEIERLLGQYRSYRTQSDKPRPSELRDHFEYIDKHLGAAIFRLMGGAVPSDLVDVLPDGQWPNADTPEVLFCQWDDIPDQTRVLLAEGYEAESRGTAAAADDPWPRASLTAMGITDIPAAPKARNAPETEVRYQPETVSRKDASGKNTERVSYRGVSVLGRGVISVPSSV